MGFFFQKCIAYKIKVSWSIQSKTSKFMKNINANFFKNSFLTGFYYQSRLWEFSVVVFFFFPTRQPSERREFLGVGLALLKVVRLE